MAVGPLFGLVASQFPAGREAECAEQVSRLAWVMLKGRKDCDVRFGRAATEEERISNEMMIPPETAVADTDGDEEITYKEFVKKMFPTDFSHGGGGIMDFPCDDPAAKGSETIRPRAKGCDHSGRRQGEESGSGR